MDMLDADRGLFMPNHDDATVKSAMIAAGRATPTSRPSKPSTQ